MGVLKPLQGPGKPPDSPEIQCTGVGMAQQLPLGQYTTSVEDWFADPNNAKKQAATGELSIRDDQGNHLHYAPMDIRSEVFWAVSKKDKSWMPRSLVESWCCFLQAAAQYPSTIKPVQVLGFGDNAFDNGLQTKEAAPDIIQARLQSLTDSNPDSNKPGLTRNQIDFQKHHLAYLVGFQDHHYAAIIAFPSSRTILVMDGMFRPGKANFPNPREWQNWILILLWCGTNKPLHGRGSIELVFHDEQICFGEAAVRVCPATGGAGTDWHCYTCSDSIQQNTNATECGYLACMNIWSKIYHTKGWLEAPKRSDVTLLKARSSVIDMFQSMVKMLSSKKGYLFFKKASGGEMLH